MDDALQAETPMADTTDTPMQQNAAEGAQQALALGRKFAQQSMADDQAQEELASPLPSNLNQPQQQAPKQRAGLSLEEDLKNNRIQSKDPESPGYVPPEDLQKVAEPDHAALIPDMPLMKEAMDKGPAKIGAPVDMKGHVPNAPPGDMGVPMAPGAANAATSAPSNTIQAHHTEGGGIGGFAQAVSKGLESIFGPANPKYPTTAAGGGVDDMAYASENPNRSIADVIKGAALGAGQIMDSALALTPGPDNPITGAISKATGLPTYPYKSNEKEAMGAITGGDEQQQKELEHNPLAQATKFVTEMAPYMASPISEVGGATEAALTGSLGKQAAKQVGRIVGAASSIGEGALINALASIQKQRAEKNGKVDPHEVLTDALIGGGIGAAGALLGAGAKKLFGPGSEEERVKTAKQILGQIKHAQEMASDLIDTAHEEEIRSAKMLAEALGPMPPRTPRQEHQQQMLNDVDYSLRLLGNVDNLWDISTPAEIGAMETLVDAGYISVESVEAELQKRGYRLQPLLISMQKQIVPPSQRQRYLDMAAEMDKLASAQAKEKNHTALEAQHPWGPSSQEPLPLPVVNEPKRLGGLKLGARAETNEERDARILKSPEYYGIFKELSTKHPKMSTEKLNEATQKAFLKKHPELSEPQQVPTHVPTEPGRYEEALREQGKWPAKLGAEESSYIPLPAEMPVRGGEPTPAQVARTEQIKNAEDFPALLPMKPMTEEENTDAVNALALAKEVGPEAEHQVLLTLDEEFGAGTAENIERQTPRESLKGEVSEEAEVPAKEEEPAEYSGEDLRQTYHFGAGKKANIEFPGHMERRLFEHANKLNFLEKGQGYPHSDKITKSLAEDLGVKPQGEANKIAKDYTRKVLDDAKKVASEEGGHFAAPPLTVPDNLDKYSVQELMSKFDELVKASDKAKGAEKEAVDKQIDELENHMQGRFSTKAGKKAKPETPDERAEEALKEQKPNATKEELKETIEAVKEAGGPVEPGPNAPADSGIFRRPDRGAPYHGYGRAENGIPFSNAKGFISEEHYEKGEAALTEIGQAKMALMIAKDDAFHAGKAALDLAKTEAEKQKVSVKVEDKLKHAYQSDRNKLRAGLELEQHAADQAEVDELEEQIAELEATAKRTRAHKEKEQLRGQIQTLHERMTELHDNMHPLMPTDESLYTVANPKNLTEHLAANRKAPATFPEALDAFDAANKNLIAAEKHWKATSQKHAKLFGEIKDSYIQANKNVRPNVEQESPTWAYNIPHPTEPSVTVEATTQAQFNKSGAVLLNGERARKLAAWDEATKRIADAWNVVQAYARKGGKNVNFAAPEALKHLAAKGLLDPKVKIAMSAAVLGATGPMSVQSAHAAGMDDMTDEERTRQLATNAILGGAALLVLGYTAVSLGAKFGVPALKKLPRTPSYYVGEISKFTEDHLKDADQAMGITESEESSAHQYANLLGTLQMVHIRAQDDYPEMLAAVEGRTLSGKATGKYDKAKLGEEGLEAVRHAHETTQDFTNFIRGYVKDQWDPFYRGLDGPNKGKFAGTNENVHFVHDQYVHTGPNRGQSPMMNAYTWFRKNQTHYHFSGKLKTQLGAYVFEIASIGPLGLGTATTARVIYEMGFNPILAKFLQGAHLPGPWTEVNAALGKVKVPGAMSMEIARLGGDTAQKPLIAEIHKARLLYAGAAFKYYNLYPDAMKSHDFRNWRDFLTWTTEGPIHDDTMVDFHNYSGRIMSQAGRADFTHTEQDFVQRTPEFRYFIRYTTGQFTESKLLNKKLQQIFTTGMRGDVGGMLENAIDVLVFLGGKWQIGGALAVPASLYYLLQNIPATQNFVFKMTALMNATSAGHHVAKFTNVGYDTLVPAMTGVANELADDWEYLTGDLAESMSGIVGMSNIFTEGRQMDLLTGSAADADIRKGRAALHKLFRFILTNLPKEISVPGSYLDNFSAALPHVLNSEYEVGVSRLTMGGGTTRLPLKAKSTYFAVPATDAEGNQIESESDMKGRVIRDSVIEALGMKNPTVADIEEIERAKVMTGQPENYPDTHTVGAIK